LAYTGSPLLSNPENPKTDERKYALLLAATILAARKLASLDSTTGATPAKTCAVEDAIDKAKFILDRRQPIAFRQAIRGDVRSEVLPKIRTTH
jgi:hypothetical protein